MKISPKKGAGSETRDPEKKLSRIEGVKKHRILDPYPQHWGWPNPRLFSIVDTGTVLKWYRYLKNSLSIISVGCVVFGFVFRTGRYAYLNEKR
jgi:hypothetical protein